MTCKKVYRDFFAIACRRSRDRKPSVALCVRKADCIGLLFLVLACPFERVLAEEAPVPLPLYFMEPSDVFAATNVIFRVTSPEERSAPTVLLPPPKKKPQCWYAPVATEQREGGARIWYQRIDSSEPEFANQRVFCLGEIRGGRFVLPDFKNGFSPWAQEPNVVMRRSPYKPTWGGFNVHQILEWPDGQHIDSRYVMLYWDQPSEGKAGGLLAVSQDGIDWKTITPSPVFTEHNDAFTLIWNAEAREYWLYQTELEDWPDKPYPDNLAKWCRVISLRRSRDLKSWSPQEVILRPDDLDPKACEFYLLKVFRYRSRFVGLLMPYQADPDRPRLHGSHTTAELIVSDDGVRWRRPFRGVDIGFWSYADGFHLGGKLCFVTGYKSGLMLHQLRPDGLVSCGTPAEAKDSRKVKGVFTTQLFKIPARPLLLNFDASHGALGVEILDPQGRPVSGFTANRCRFEGINGTKVVLKWTARDLSQMKNQIVRLRFHLEHARVYSLRAEE